MLPGRLDDAEREWHTTQPPMTAPPVVVEHPIDPELQTGESQKLGGAMQIKAPWLKR
jgi:hypothetical protein